MNITLHRTKNLPYWVNKYANIIKSLQMVPRKVSPTHKLRVIRSMTNDPFFNLAYERKLYEDHITNPPTNNSEIDVFSSGNIFSTLYLWCNSPSVIIGRHQNANRECNLQQIEKDGVNLIRRKSGGGAVYHDFGNSLFTIISNTTPIRTIDVTKRHNNLILTNALASLGVVAKATGRNDIHVNDQKISGSAYRIDHDVFLQHGTMLLNLDTTKLPKYLNPSKAKLESKGITSVQSRVVNLSTYVPNITRDMWDSALVESFLTTNGCDHVDDPVVTEIIDHKTLYNDVTIQKYIDHAKSWKWRFGEEPPFTHRFETRFKWGTIDILLQVKSNVIQKCTMYTDSLDVTLAGIVERGMCGVVYSHSDIKNAFKIIRSIDCAGSDDTHYNIHTSTIDIENHILTHM